MTTWHIKCGTRYRYICCYECPSWNFTALIGWWFLWQAFCSSITGTLATMAVLKGVGVGDSTATPLAATLTWMLKGKEMKTAHILFTKSLLWLDKHRLVSKQYYYPSWPPTRWHRYAGEDSLCLDVWVSKCERSTDHTVRGQCSNFMT